MRDLTDEKHIKYNKLYSYIIYVVNYIPASIWTKLYQVQNVGTKLNQVLNVRTKLNHVHNVWIKLNQVHNVWTKLNGYINMDQIKLMHAFSPRLKIGTRVLTRLDGCLIDSRHVTMTDSI